MPEHTDPPTDEADLPPDDPAQRRLPPLLRRAWYSLNQALRRRIAHLNLTPDQFTVLRWLQEYDPEGVTQRDLTELMASDPNTVTSVLSRMEQAELIDRQPDPDDRRAKRVRIRQRGQRIYTEARQIAVDLQTEVLSVLPESERERFLAGLEQVADAARDAADRHAPDSRS
jgi:DNA-binding MarR family transcriptional regulator